MNHGTNLCVVWKLAGNFGHWLCRMFEFSCTEKHRHLFEFSRSENHCHLFEFSRSKSIAICWNSRALKIIEICLNFRAVKIISNHCSYWCIYLVSNRSLCQLPKRSEVSEVSKRTSRFFPLPSLSFFPQYLPNWPLSCLHQFSHAHRVRIEANIIRFSANKIAP